MHKANEFFQRGGAASCLLPGVTIEFSGTGVLKLRIKHGEKPPGSEHLPTAERSVASIRTCRSHSNVKPGAETGGVESKYGLLLLKWGSALIMAFRRQLDSILK